MYPRGRCSRPCCETFFRDGAQERFVDVFLELRPNVNADRSQAVQLAIEASNPTLLRKPYGSHPSAATLSNDNFCALVNRH